MIIILLCVVWKGTSSDPYPNTNLGTLTDSVNGSQYVTEGTAKFNSIKSAWSFSKIVESIMRGYPVQAASGHYINGKRNGGHMVIIYMTQFVDNASGTYDPLDGTSHHCTYNSFCNGSYNNAYYDQTVYVIY